MPGHLHTAPRRAGCHKTPSVGAERREALVLQPVSQARRQVPVKEPHQGRVRLHVVQPSHGRSEHPLAQPAQAAADDQHVGGGRMLREQQRRPLRVRDRLREHIGVAAILHQGEGTGALPQREVLVPRLALGQQVEAAERGPPRGGGPPLEGRARQQIRTRKRGPQHKASHRGASPGTGRSSERRHGQSGACDRCADEEHTRPPPGGRRA